jgi:hypothetical protein
MPTREEMIAALREEAPKKKPSREEMIAALRGSPTDNRGLLSKGADYGFRVLDYLGGIGRTSAQGAYDLYMMTKDPKHRPEVGIDDFKKAVIQGQAPTTEQFLERRGVGKGFEVDLNPWLKGKTTGRDIVGFAGDIVTDPTGPITQSLSKLGKGGKAIATILNPISAATEKAGEKVFKSGLKNVDKDLVEKGKGALSDILWDERTAGSMKKLSGVADKAKEKLMSQRAKLYQAANDAGALVDMSDVVKNAEKEIAKVRANPGTRDLAEKLTDYLNRYKSEGFVDVQSASDWKTALYDSLPATAFGPDGKVKGVAKNFEKALAKDFKLAIEKAADDVAPGMGREINKINEKVGTILTARKPINREIKKAVTPNSGTQVDVMFGGLGGSIGGMFGGWPGAAIGTATAIGSKNAMKAFNTTGGRTRTGLLLNQFGKTGLLDNAARRGLINLSEEDEEKLKKFVRSK